MGRRFLMAMEGSLWGSIVVNKGPGWMRCVSLKAVGWANDSIAVQGNFPVSVSIISRTRSSYQRSDYSDRPASADVEV